MDSNVRTVRSFKKLKPIPEIPEAPAFITPFLPSPSNSLLPTSQNDQHGSSHTTSLIPGSPFHNPGSLGGSLSQPQLIKPPESNAQKLSSKFERMETFLKDSGFDSVGKFLKILFYNPSHLSGESDPRGTCHVKAVSRFLQGRNKVKMSDIISLIYKHKHSAPSPASPLYSERHALFSPSVSPGEIFHARLSLFSWATNLVADHVHHEIYALTAKDDNTQLRASTNGRCMDRVNVVTWEALGRFSISALCEKYKARAPVSWYLTESMTASRKNGIVILKKRCPHPIVQVGAISSFILTRNHYANGDLAMVLGIWHFAAKSHVDVKRVYSRFGKIISDTTARKALDSMTGSSLAILQASVKAATERGETEWCVVLDNVQEYCPVYEGGIARQSILKVGTAATAIRLDDCKPGSFDLQSHLACVAQKKRKTMTVETLRNDIDWTHPIAKHRMREGRKTVVQPLGTNAERETETQGMARAIMDFDEQMGIDSRAADRLLSWNGGDGASYAAALCLQKYLCSIPDNHKSFRNRISTPEIWHSKATMVNSIAANHYGPATSQDPSSLSRCSGAAGFKRPTNLNSCDYYPTVRSMTLIWEAQVLDCWRVFLEAKSDLLSHFANLEEKKELPSLETILIQADILVRRYASQDAYEQALSLLESKDAPDRMKVPFHAPISNIRSLDIAMDISQAAPPALPTEDVPKVHHEADKFDGDWVLANSILFLQDFGWWTEISYAVPEGDIGRVFEILKVQSGYLALLDHLIKTTCTIFWKCTVFCDTRPLKIFVTQF
ncbi:uncharacterized protein LACBIDRAFT_330448 [Laccaria bicolor S238N-H82]|uniref:Predicted protein n=1 Tax=Laccaria bicolor (strain S238N-H82 / ATCC MYA-4686) TaxID=486041 RepID=B0DLB9_LACBS|nr:uncharacterized protein LACBIDRAFT_330448 [Laccaria bicolor S238N-H82]EDR04537.1 predicted protein [Laccaria bicolor S238N-H82]|eukprot:XP_001884709.1 predicted protein [Laccaria bicolor S238N-H82]